MGKRSKTTKRKSSALLEKGIGASALGIAFLALPSFFGSSPALNAIATGLRTTAWMALGIGVVLLGLHFAINSKKKEPGAQPKASPRRPTTEELQKMFDLATDVSDRGSTRVANPVHAQPAPQTSWSPAVFAAIEWRRFEAVCETLFAQAGFQTRAQSHGADGGVDIWLHSANAQGPAAVVQCKHWQGKSVGVKELREFFGVMSANKLKRGTYATTSSYTEDAQQFAKANGINAMDGPALLGLIAKRTPEQQQALLAVAYEGEYWRPTCASCGIKLVERKPSKGGAKFWGCSNYPSCKSRLPMLAAMR